jgi:aerobic carbon-monoxide dehydrogenase large subunit
VRSTDAAGTLHAALLRSPYAHARIQSISVNRARRLPGMVAVITGADLLDSVSPLPTNWVLPGMHVPVHRVLADQVVRFHGEAIAAVVAVDAAAAADAVQAIEVGYEPLPAVTDPWRAAQPDAPLVHPGLDGASEHGNILFRVPAYAGNYAAARQAADVVVGQRLRNQNLIPGALEPRSVLADYDDGTGTVTVHSSTQSPHVTTSSPRSARRRLHRSGRRGTRPGRRLEQDPGPRPIAHDRRGAARLASRGIRWCCWGGT